MVLAGPINEITSILTAVDEVIESTTAQINKLKDLKTGMMQELLTKGIGHTEFKDSPVGRIPKAWDVHGIYDVCNEIFLGLTSKVDYVEVGGVPLVRATDISKGVLSFSNVRKISPVQHKALTKLRRAQRGDILVSKSGSLGVCAVVDTDIEFSIYESIIVLSPKESILSSKFLLWVLRSSEMQGRLLNDTVGSTVGHLNLSDFRKLKIAMPPYSEQVQLALMFDALDNKQASEKLRLEKYLKLKTALMQDLLTGKVRVNAN